MEIDFLQKCPVQGRGSICGQRATGRLSEDHLRTQPRPLCNCGAGVGFSPLNLEQ